MAIMPLVGGSPCKHGSYGKESYQRLASGIWRRAFFAWSETNMLDIRALRQDGEAIKTALTKRGYTLDLDAFAALDAKRKQADIRSQELQADRKKASKQVGELIKSGMAVEDAKSQVAETLQTIDAELDREVASAKAIRKKSVNF